MGPIGKSGLVALVAAMLLATTLGGYLIYADANQGSVEGSVIIGYDLRNTVLDEDMTHHPGCLDISVEQTDARYDFTGMGMVCSFRSPSDFVLMEKDEVATALTTRIDITALDLVGRGGFHFGARFLIGSGGAYEVEVIVDQYRTKVTYTVEHAGARVEAYGDLFYDATDILDILVQVGNGKIVLGINGIEDSQGMSALEKFSPKFDGMWVGAGSEDPVVGNIYVTRFALGRSDQNPYQDVLHKTIVPDGKDLAFSLHVHADRAYPDHFHLMANLSREYGLKGTHDAWFCANSQFYSMNEPEYTEGLHDLQDSGWDIGVHAIGYVNVNRTVTIYALDRMTEEFGPMRTWSDHGQRLQDLWKDGTDPDSGYYVADLVEEIGAAWMHKNSKAHSFYNDLNRDGMSYTDPDNPDLPLFRVSKMQAWTMYSDPGREDDIDTFLRAWPADRSVIVTHDYFPYFFYVKYETGPLCILPDEEGIGYFPWSSLISKSTFVGEEWAPLPSFVRFLNWTTNYDVWFAPVRDIYDRSCLIQGLEVREDATKVVIRNPSVEDIRGLTLFTKSKPGYHLSGVTGTYHAEKGSVGSWHFVLDVGAGEEIVLHKEGLPSSPSADILVDVPMVEKDITVEWMMSDRREWS